MAEKKKKKTAQTTYSEMDGNYEFALRLPKSVYTNAPLLRRLHARVGELLIDRGLEEWLVDDLEICLRMVSARLMCEYVDGLIRETIAADEEDRKRMAVTDAAFDRRTETKKARKRQCSIATGKRTRAGAARRKEVGRG